MAVWRAILNKTVLFTKGKVTAQSGRELKRYMARYVDEVGKAATKSGEGPKSPKTGKTEPRWLLPEESTGVLWAGGFLGESSSPGMASKNKQLGWCRAFANKWRAELEKNTRRRNDGLRYVISLGPKSVQDLTASGISTDQALRSIWQQTVELYRERHGWTGPEGELGWVAGAHHDTDNAHMHLIIFPTTKGGSVLRTNYRGVGKNKIDDMNDLNALVGIASEMFWRDNLGLEYQSKEYQEQTAADPENEPPLPEIKDFKNATVEKPSKQRDKAPTLKTGLMSRDAAEDVLLALGTTKPIRKLTSKAIRRMESYVAILEAFGESRKPSIWELFRQIDKKPDEAIATLEESFPEETQSLKALEEEIKKGKNKWERRTAADWKKRGAGWARALLEVVMGIPNKPSRENTRAKGLKLAETYEESFKTIPEGKLKVVWKMGTDYGLNAKKERSNASRYRPILRSLRRRLEPGSRSLTLMEKILQGAQRLGETLEARKAETRAVIKSSRGKYEFREVDREWTLEKNNMVPKPSKGQPWPLHMDPELVFEELKKEGNPEAPRKKRSKEEIEEELTEIKRAEGESILGRLGRVLRPRRVRRKTKALEQMRSQPEMGGPGE